MLLWLGYNKFCVYSVNYFNLNYNNMSLGWKLFSLKSKQKTLYYIIKNDECKIVP